MRCPNCGNRVPDAVAATTTECPTCRKPLRPSQEGTAPASQDYDSQALTQPYVRAAGAPAADRPAENRSVADSGAHKTKSGAYTARFDLDDMPAAAAPSGAASKADDTAETTVPRDQAMTLAKAGKGAAPAPTAPTVPAGIPDRLGHFRVTGKLGEGGMGEVLDGHDPQLDRRVAIKVLSSKLAQDDGFVQRFLSEARAVARVSHVNVAGVYFAATDAGRHFFAMEFIEGESLDELIERQGPLTPKVAVGYVVQSVRGLAAAHERGIIHRDIKPANLMLSKENVIKLTDFGLAKLSGEDVRRTQAGSVMGSPHFMAPEQGRGEETDLRADVYSLGATLYYLLAGETPYKADSAVAVILKHQEAPVPQIARAPPSVNRLLGRMMAKDRNGRYQSYANLMTDLIRLDKSGLLRDDVTLDQAGAATAGLGGMAGSRAATPAGSGPMAGVRAATPAGSGPMAGVRAATPVGTRGLTRAAPPGRESDPGKTVKTDDEAVLLSQLDAVMKEAPAGMGGTGGTSKLRRGAAQRIRSAAASVTRRVLRPDETAKKEEGVAEGEPGDEESRSLPMNLIALGVGATIFLLFVIALRPWGWGGSGGGAPAGPVERPEVLEAIEVLSPALKDEEPAVRRDAVMALGRYPGPSSEGLILSMLADPDPVVRAEAARVLGQVGRRQEVQWRVFGLLSDTSPEVRQAVVEALEKLTGYTRLSTIDWRQSPEGLRRAVREEFEIWLKER